MSPHARLAVLAAAPPIVHASLAVVAATLCMVSMHALIRHLSAELHPFEIAFFRNLFGLGVFVPWFVRVGLVALRTRRFGLHFGRSVANAGSMLCWFWALSLLPLADATALALSGPMFVAVGATLFLGESLRLRRWLALVVGAGGALVIIQPGFQAVSLGMMLVLANVVLVSVSKLAAKELTRTDGSAPIVAWVTLLMTPLSFLAAIWVWVWPSWDQLLVLVCIGTLGSSSPSSRMPRSRHSSPRAHPPHRRHGAREGFSSRTRGDLLK